MGISASVRLGMVIHYQKIKYGDTNYTIMVTKKDLDELIQQKKVTEGPPYIFEVGDVEVISDE